MCCDSYIILLHVTVLDANTSRFSYRIPTECHIRREHKYIVAHHKSSFFSVHFHACFFLLKISAHHTTTAVYQVTRLGHEHCDITEGVLLDITPLVVDGKKLVTLYDKDLTEGINLLIGKFNLTDFSFRPIRYCFHPSHLRFGSSAGVCNNKYHFAVAIRTRSLAALFNPDRQDINYCVICYFFFHVRVRF